MNAKPNLSQSNIINVDRLITDINKISILDSEIIFFTEKFEGILSTNNRVEILSKIKQKSGNIISYNECILKLLKAGLNESDLDLKILEDFIIRFKEYKLIDTGETFHININPKTLLLDKYWEDLLCVLWQNNNIGLFENIAFEIIEVSEHLPIIQIEDLNNKISFLKDNFGISTGIDDYPCFSNGEIILKNILGIDFVKIDKESAIAYGKGELTLSEFIIKIDGYIKLINKKNKGKEIDIIIEGVEDEDTYQLLREYFPEITYFQGHLFSTGEPLKPKSTDGSIII